MAKETTFLGATDVDGFVSVMEGLDRDDLKFLTSLPDDEACGLVLIIEEDPLGLIHKIEHSIRNEDVPGEFRAFAYFLLKEVRRQLAVVKRACRVVIENRQREMGDAVAQGLDASMKIGNLLRQAEVFMTCGPDQIKAFNSRDHEARTILAANARRSAEAAQFWRPHKQEFQRLVSQKGMKKHKARREIGDRLAEKGKVYSDEYLRQRLT